MRFIHLDANGNPYTASGHLANLPEASLLTISSGAITVTGDHHTVAVESGTEDDLATISGLGDRHFCYLRPANAAHTITLKHGTDNIYIVGGADLDLTNGCGVLVLGISTNVFVIGGGGGGGGADVKVKVSSNDTTADYLFNKLAAGGLVELEETNDGGDEDVTIRVLDPEEYGGGNLNRNFPSLELADGARPMHWFAEDANITITEEDCAGESIPELHERCHKIVTGAGGANKYIRQRYTYAHEALLDAGVTYVSAAVWVFIPTGTSVTVTLEAYDDNGGSLGTDATSTENAWTRLAVENKQLDGSGTYCDLRVKLSAASKTIYTTKPVFNKGPKARPWKERGLKRIDDGTADVVNGADPAGTGWTDVDVESDTHPLAVLVELYCRNTTSGSTYHVYARRNGSSAGQDNSTAVSVGSGTGTVQGRQWWASIVMLDEDQMYEYSAEHANVEEVYHSIRAYWRWADD